MPPEGFEPAIPPIEQLQSHALDRAATGIANIVEETFLLAKAELYKVSRRFLHLLPANLLHHCAI